MTQRPKRNPLAYIFAIFIPGGNVAQGGPVSALIMVVMIGLLAAMAIPAFQKVRQASQAKVCINNQAQLAAALEEYRLEHKAGAQKWEDVAGPGKLLPNMPVCLLGGTYSANVGPDQRYHVTCSIPGHDPASFAAGRPAPARR